MSQLLRSAHLRPWAAPVTHRTDIAEAWHRHGAALFALSLVLFEDVDDAESVVTQAFLDACTPVDIALAPVTRRELARYVYVLWVRRTAEPDSPRRLGSSARPGWRPSGIAAMTGLSHRQRTAIALAMFGEHTYTEIATLMELPAGDIASLMRSGLLAAAATSA
jgi:hypothetical protein